MTSGARLSIVSLLIPLCHNGLLRKERIEKGGREGIKCVLQLIQMTLKTRFICFPIGFGSVLGLKSRGKQCALEDDEYRDQASGEDSVSD